MSEPSLRLFLSTVTSELGCYRLALKKSLIGPRIEVKEQQDFINCGKDTLGMLDEYIRHCSGVIHLLGDATGEFPAQETVQALLDRYERLGRPFTEKVPVLRDILAKNIPLSFTQWEAYLALYHGRHLFLFQVSHGSQRGPEFKPDANQKVWQDWHRQRLQSIDRFGKPFTNENELCTFVWQEMLNRSLGEYLPAAEKEVAHARLLHSIAPEHTRNALAKMHTRLYREDIFFERKALTEALIRFATAHQVSATALLLTGRSGSGKSAIMTHIASLLSDSSHEYVNQCTVLFIQGEQIRPPSGTHRPLVWYLLGLARVEDDDAAATPTSLTRIFERLDKEVLSEGRKFILILDGMNEVQGKFEDAYRDMLDLIGIATQFPWLRIIASIREEFIEVYRNRLVTMADPINEVASSLFAPGPEVPREYHHADLPVWVVPDFTMEERRGMYERYREIRRQDSSCPACLTPWHGISADARESVMLRPLHIRLWMDLFNGREATDDVRSLHSLLHKYIEDLYQRFPGLKIVLHRIMSYLLSHGKSRLDMEDVSELGRNDAPGRVSMVDSALLSGLFIQDGDTYKVFHDRMGEVLAANFLMGEIARNDSAWLSTLPRTHLLLGALEVLVLSWIAEKRYVEAHSVLDQVDFQLSPRNSWLFQAGRIKTSLSLRQKLKGVLSQRHERENLYQIGLAHIRLGKWQEADDVFEEALQLDPNATKDVISAAIWMYRSSLLQRDGKLEEAHRLGTDALRVARGTTLEGNALGHLAYTDFLYIGGARKVLGNGTRFRILWWRWRHWITLARIRRHLNWSIEFCMSPGLHKKIDNRSAIFWRTRLGEVLMSTGHFKQAIDILEAANQQAIATERDAQCDVYIYWFLGRAYAQANGFTYHSQHMYDCALAKAIEIGDCDNSKAIDRERSKWG
jgi:tetratricopeptide (TPR) repeat protein/energy-coupling factor transporter ATP-binding protein EcfA2